MAEERKEDSRARLMECRTMPKGPVAALSSLLLVGCSSLDFIPSQKFPLCPQIAEMSYGQDDATGKTVNLYVQEQAHVRHLRINPISEYVAEVHGNPVDLQWFTKNYPQMLCSFDPRQESHVKETYISCVSHVSNWIKIVRSEHPEALMYDKTLFEANCASL
ncbi:hypothetical protein [Mesorhizobium sp. B2-3-5]|uniref:hypothetical protein n=1 Tax=Mesorhizobium sp. B2-3-5 TaxID=2589958 RepID=UPI00112DD2A9|nr:hypothetical protein [Mesorhizobium sp. B2-3-5]TPM35525.1 hypothetical protein FJ958_06410 [Mesorhizobium sp. B2-3-5]